MAAADSSSPGPGDLDQEGTARRLSRSPGQAGAMTQVETATSFAPLTLGCAQSLDSTLFFRGISFCSNGAGRRQNPTHAIIGIKSYIGTRRLSRWPGQAGHDQVETATSFAPLTASRRYRRRDPKVYFAVTPLAESSQNSPFSRRRGSAGRQCRRAAHPAARRDRARRNSRPRAATPDGRNAPG